MLSVITVKEHNEFIQSEIIDYLTVTLDEDQIKNLHDNLKVLETKIQNIFLDKKNGTDEDFYFINPYFIKPGEVSRAHKNYFNSYHNIVKSDALRSNENHFQFQKRYFIELLKGINKFFLSPKKDEYQKQFEEEYKQKCEEYDKKSIEYSREYEQQSLQYAEEYYQESVEYKVKCDLYEEEYEILRKKNDEKYKQEYSKSQEEYKARCEKRLANIAAHDQKRKRYNVDIKQYISNNFESEKKGEIKKFNIVKRIFILIKEILCKIFHFEMKANSTFDKKIKDNLSAKFKSEHHFEEKIFSEISFIAPEKITIEHKIPYIKPSRREISYVPPIKMKKKEVFEEESDIKIKKQLKSDIENGLVKQINIEEIEKKFEKDLRYLEKNLEIFEKFINKLHSIFDSDHKNLKYELDELIQLILNKTFDPKILYSNGKNLSIDVFKFFLKFYFTLGTELSERIETLV